MQGITVQEMFQGSKDINVSNNNDVVKKLSQEVDHSISYRSSENVRVIILLCKLLLYLLLQQNDAFVCKILYFHCVPKCRSNYG